jgi:predicted  nucleic acid-binding Zn-ribbon protein
MAYNGCFQYQGIPKIGHARKTQGKPVKREIRRRGERMARRRRNSDDGFTAEERRALDRIEKLFDQAADLEDELGIVDAEIEDAIEEIKGTERELKRLDRFVKGKQAQAEKLQSQIKDLDIEAQKIAKAAGVENYV